tara:strand:+ start:1369 stop:1644 length:276 start_codon:yes stop_codon:yes gene_type:complete
MNGYFEENHEKFRDYDSDLLLNILNKTSIETQNSEKEELFVDENWKINKKNMSNIVTSNDSNLKNILSGIFPDKEILIKNNNDGSQTIFLS